MELIIQKLLHIILLFWFEGTPQNFWHGNANTINHLSYILFHLLITEKKKFFIFNILLQFKCSLPRLVIEEQYHNCNDVGLLVDVISTKY